MRFSTTHCLHMIEIKMSKVIYFEPLKKHYNYKTFKLKYILDFNVKTFHPIRVSPLSYAKYTVTTYLLKRSWSIIQVPG
jgi:hypothetical protein